MQRTELIPTGSIRIDDEDRGPDGNAPIVTVTRTPAGKQPITVWDAIPEWDGRVNELTLDEITGHPTVQRLLTARNAPA